MRIEGRIKSWNDERGFGFIEPLLGGQEIFVHIKAFKGRQARPQVDQNVVFSIELDAQGKKRATLVEFSRPARRPAAAVQQRAAKRSSMSTVFVLIALGVLGAGLAWGQAPRWAAGWYGGVSLLCFLFYAADKSAAQKGNWRISEQTLHMLALVGGWPGAALAQHSLRHKSSKRAFREVFWATVVINLIAFFLLAREYAEGTFL